MEGPMKSGKMEDNHHALDNYKIFHQVELFQNKQKTMVGRPGPSSMIN